MYTLEELAERWNKTENDIIRMAVAGKIILSAWYSGYVLVYSPPEPEDDVGEWKRVRWGSYWNTNFSGPIDIQSHDLCGFIAASADPVLIHCAEVEGVEYIFSEDSPIGVFSEESRNKPYRSFALTREQLLITPESLEAAETKYPELVSGVPKNNPQLPQIPIISREPEKPLKTIKAIAEYCEVHESTVKTWRKQYKDFPASTPGSGTVTALPSELNGWMVRRGKK
jgi:hypothetical protein